jgi:glycosyltransferase involved in cell wall biosynthesis
VYRTACGHAHAIASESDAVKDDLVNQYGLDPRKIFVVRWGSPTAFYDEVHNEDLPTLRGKFGLPERFAFYPAQTWPHKNHIRLLEAVSVLRDRHRVRLSLVCTGRKNKHWPSIERRIMELRLARQVSFLGYLTSAELRALYHLAQFLVFPSLFEGGGFPVLEGFHEGAPVICSDIPPLREYGGDAVLTFDPRSTDSIAASLLRISGDEGLREQLRTRGKERVRLFTWERTAKAYRALYRKVAGVSLSEEDSRLLTSDDGANPGPALSQ